MFSTTSSKIISKLERTNRHLKKDIQWIFTMHFYFFHISKFLRFHFQFHCFARSFLFIFKRKPRIFHSICNVSRTAHILEKVIIFAGANLICLVFSEKDVSSPFLLSLPNVLKGQGATHFTARFDDFFKCFRPVLSHFSQNNRAQNANFRKGYEKFLMILGFFHFQKKRIVKKSHKSTISLIRTKWTHQRKFIVSIFPSKMSSAFLV